MLHKETTFNSINKTKRNDILTAKNEYKICWKFYFSSVYLIIYDNFTEIIVNSNLFLELNTNFFSINGKKNISLII